VRCASATEFEDLFSVKVEDAVVYVGFFADFFDVRVVYLHSDAF
jgi:hypothetical protein